MEQISADMGAEPPSKEDVKEVLDHLDTDVRLFKIIIFYFLF